jgi:hypothetical protein
MRRRKQLKGNLEEKRVADQQSNPSTISKACSIQDVPMTIDYLVIEMFIEEERASPEHARPSQLLGCTGHPTDQQNEHLGPCMRKLGRDKGHLVLQLSLQGSTPTVCHYALLALHPRMHLIPAHRPNFTRHDFGILRAAPVGLGG